MNTDWSRNIQKTAGQTRPVVSEAKMMGIQLFQYEITFFDGRDKATRIVVATDVVEAAATARVGCDLHQGYRLQEIKEHMRPTWCKSDDMHAPQQVSEAALREYARRLGFEVSKSR